MRNFINKIKSKFQKAAVTAKVAVENKRAEGYIDTAVKIIIGVVIGGVILAGFYTLFNTTVIPTLTSKIGEMFSYTGT
ncbi:MAG: hypothetical protein IKC59_07355 [Clostridia bacterium]|nr:hypothetical protein [Clostridia bacterium]